MTELAAALAALDGERLTITEALRRVEDCPGMYAVYADADVWNELGLGDPPDERPLYVGIATVSLLERDMKTHFSTRKTGKSTLRRSLAGLLATRLDLHGQPRTLTNPGYFHSFGLEPAGDQRLTDWMHRQLRIVTWATPVDSDLDGIETQVLNTLFPPLNLKKVRTPWTAQVSAGRASLAAQARAWTPPTTR